MKKGILIGIWVIGFLAMLFLGYKIHQIRSGGNEKTETVKEEKKERKMLTDDEIKQNKKKKIEKLQKRYEKDYAYCSGIKRVKTKLLDSGFRFIRTGKDTAPDGVERMTAVYAKYEDGINTEISIGVFEDNYFYKVNCY
jgi:hypothetical protein